MANHNKANKAKQLAANEAKRKEAEREAALSAEQPPASDGVEQLNLLGDAEPTPADPPASDAEPTPADPLASAVEPAAPDPPISPCRLAAPWTARTGPFQLLMVVPAGSTLKTFAVENYQLPKAPVETSVKRWTLEFEDFGETSFSSCVPPVLGGYDIETALRWAESTGEPKIIEGVRALMEIWQTQKEADHGGI